MMESGFHLKIIVLILLSVSDLYQVTPAFSGDIEAQRQFISEMFRVSKEGVFFTTPNKYYPLDLHTKLLFIHWLPHKWRDAIFKLVGKSWATGDYMHLLSYNKLCSLLTRYVYCIHMNRIFLLPVTFQG